MRNLRSAFTLIELLVVITIIVVLLALLAPALEKAVYEAQLVQCGAQQKFIASATLVYAAGNRRYYPTNLARRDRGYGTNILGIQHDPDSDLRPVLKDYIPLTSWVDPFCQPVDLSREANGPVAIIVASYNYWAGFAYTNQGFAVSPMYKLGDKLGWRDGSHEDRVSHLVSDLNDIHANNNWIEMSHPDDKGIVQSEAHNAPTETRSWWYRNGSDGVPRGLVDLNFAYDDGSVLRYSKVTGDWVANDFESSDGTIFHGAPWHAIADVPAKRFVPVR